MAVSLSAYEEIDECEGGRIQGEKKHIPILEFLHHPLARALGKQRCELLFEVIRSRMTLKKKCFI